MKIGDTVQLHITGVPGYRHAEIVGEDIRDGKKVWLVDCPRFKILNAAFYQDDEAGKHYNYGNRAFHIERPENKMCPYEHVAFSKVPGYVEGYGCPVCKGLSYHLFID